jgi:hypothetical protein
MIEPLLRSFNTYLEKTQDLPTTSQLATEVHATARAQEILSKEMTEIKNILAAPVGKAPAPTYAQIVKDPYVLKPTTQTRPSSGPREILVKLNETNPEQTSRRATAEDVKEKVNNMLKSHQDPALQKTQIIAVKRHPSGDLTLFTQDQRSTEQLIAHREQWQQTLGEKAAVRVPSFGILVHGVSTQMEAYNRMEIEEKIQWNNPSLEKARVVYSGWLKRSLGEKRASTMVVEFEREEDADHAILNGIVFGAQIYACEYYDRTCKVKQCFKCQKYGHIGTHCKAQENCGYCAEPHSTKGCPERDRPGSEPKCPNCFNNHPSWSIQCQYRKEEFARVEERRRNMPRTHKEATLRWGNFTGKPTHANETTHTRKENGNRRAPGEPPILSATGSQRRGRSPRKDLRTNTSQGHSNTTRRVLQELDRNTLLVAGSQDTARNKRRTLEAEEPIATQDSIMSIISFDE